MEEGRIERAIDACYEAVTAPELWPDALQELAWAMDASCAMLYPKDVGTGAVAVPASRLYQPFLQEYVRGNWFDNHYRAERGWPLMAAQGVVIEHDIATDDERRKLRVYNELYLRWGYSGFAGIGFRHGGKQWCVPLLRAVRQGGGFFTREEVRRLARYRPHMRRWVSLSERFELSGLKAGIEALDRVGCAALLIGSLGRVEAANSRAEALLSRERSAIALKGGRLYATDVASDRRLRALISAALAPEAGTSRGKEASPIVIEQASLRPLVVEAVSVGGIVSAISTRARSILLLTDLNERQIPRDERLQMTFGLTRAEAKLASALAAGTDLRGAADMKSVSYETARVQLKAIFQKTGVQRQSDLVGLLSRLR